MINEEISILTMLLKNRYLVLKYFNFKMNIVCPSNWLLNITKKSQLFKKRILSYIPLSIDTNFWIKKSKIDSKTINANEKIKIGLLVPLTGKNSEIGQSILKSVRLAIGKINNLSSAFETIGLISVS